MTNSVQAFEKWPSAWKKGIIKTKNKMGIMTMELSPPSQAFVEQAKTAQKPMLDIGCAYGAATIPALINGARVIACDLAEEHLSILEKSVPKECKQRLQTRQAAFPYELDFEDGSLSAINISMVLHFMKGDDILVGLKKCYRWLESGGKLYVNNMTPSLGVYDWQKLTALYNERVKNNEQWPGEMNSRLLVREEWRDQIPEFTHFFELDTLRFVTEASGFFVEDIYYFCYDLLPEEHKTNGKEFVGVVAVKK